HPALACPDVPMVAPSDCDCRSQRGQRPRGSRRRSNGTLPASAPTWSLADLQLHDDAVSRPDLLVEDHRGLQHMAPSAIRLARPARPGTASARWASTAAATASPAEPKMNTQPSPPVG